MKGWGLGLLIVGVLVALVGSMLDTTVTSTVPSALGYGLTNTSEVINIGLLQRQKMVFDAGLALFLAGAVLLGSATIQETLRTVASGRAAITNEGEPQDTAAPPSDAWTGTTMLSRAMPEETKCAEELDREMSKWLGFIVLGILIAIAAVALFAPSTKPLVTTSTPETDAAMMADNLEAQADNLEAMADNTADANR